MSRLRLSTAFAAPGEHWIKYRITGTKTPAEPEATLATLRWLRYFKAGITPDACAA
ncbi:MAG: hypothetical protein ACFCVE_04245 [Phycisphaerae bacterium]